jgi:molecular chaperone DnaK (HSP70)
MTGTHWSIDLGTTNSLIARWMGTHAEAVHLEDICEREPAWNTPLIPSVVCFEDENRGYVGKKAYAAEEVMRATFAGRLTPLARSFKRVLARDSRQPVAEVGSQTISARQCAAVFLREILRETAERELSLTSHAIPRWNLIRRTLAWLRREGMVNDLTMTAPIDSFEAYRMELQNICRKLGVKHFRTLDEPVAAALGYGVDLTEDRNLLVADFGGGTLDIALVRTALSSAPTPRARGVGHRRAEVIAARGMNLGGETVDEWVTDMACAKLYAHAETMRPAIRAQAEQVKKELSGKVLTTQETFFRIPGGDEIVVSRQEFLDALQARGLYEKLEAVTGAVIGDARHRLSIADIDEVLLVGGSTLLPGVRELFERLFGANRVRYWNPFQAVVEGAATYGAGYYVDQIIHHDYAIRVYSESANSPQYELLIKRGTAYPTPEGFETRYYAVAPRQQLFSLPVCEVGLAGRLALEWRQNRNGHYYWQPKGTEEAECVMALNEGDAIRLYPPGAGNQARLRVDFTIDGERWLCATVHDLLRNKDIRTNDRVIRLR